MDGLRSHFSIYTQRAMLEAKISTIQEAIDFLKRLEMVEENYANRKPNPSPSNLNPMLNRGPDHGQRNDKYRPNQQFMRKVRYDHRNDYRRDNYDRRSLHYSRQDFFENGRGSSNNYSPT